MVQRTRWASAAGCTMSPSSGFMADHGLMATYHCNSCISGVQLGSLSGDYGSSVKGDGGRPGPSKEGVLQQVNQGVQVRTREDSSSPSNFCRTIKRVRKDSTSPGFPCTSQNLLYLKVVPIGRRYTIFASLEDCTCNFDMKDQERSPNTT